MFRLGGAVAFGLVLLAAEAFAVHPAYRLRVEGMVCKLCAASLQARLKAEIRGVERVDVDLAAGTVIVTTAEGASIDAETAKRTVHGAGFKLRGFETIPGDASARPR